MSESGAADQAVAMDQMYRVTRHIYDVTRAYYLLGRDRMLAKVVTNPSTATLEVGCGTARNLIKLARRAEPGLLCGLDASQEMLDTAAASIARAGVPAAGHERIRLRQGLAERLDAKTMFGRDEPFDTIFFSYCLSMVPTWPGAIEAAMANLKTGGHLVIVDFWDQKDLPGVFAAGLKKWLSLFHVHYRPEVHDALAALGTSGRADVTFESVQKRYAYIASLKKR
ncbi:MAG: class I SAM-dependent methyltransferase [Planctomycetota bacterium]|jgi:S-adenosylmethionine-diacylgycerolhomoserine-N-methlytransferase